LSRLMTSIMFNPGGETFIEGLANGVEKFSGWLVKTIRDYLPKIQGMFDRMGNWWSNFKRGWNLVLERLRPLIDGARVIEKAFGQVWQAIKEGTENMGHMRELLLANESTVIETGTRIGDLIRDVSDLFFRMKTVFFEILPFLNDVLSGIGMLIRGMTKLLTGLGGGGGSFMKALAPLLAFQIFGKRMQGVSGRLLPGIAGASKSMPFQNLSSMTVTATNVTVNGGAAGAGGPGAGAGAGAGAAASMGSGRLSSGAGGAYGPPVPPPIIGPTQQAYNQYYGPRFSRLYSPNATNQLQDFQQKTDMFGHRNLNAMPTQKGMLVGQAVPGSNMPTAFAHNGIPITNQFIPERDYQRTAAVGANGAPVYQDVRALGGVYVNSRGIVMSASQTSQNLTGRMEVDPRMRLGESMRLGKEMKQGFQKGDKFRAGMDRRRFERQEIINAGGPGVTPITGVHTPGMPAATAGRVSTGVSRGPDVDYSKMSDKRLARLARARGLDGSGTSADIQKLLKQNDRDRMLARAAVAAHGTPAQAQYERQMSHGFRGGPAYARYFYDEKTTAPDGTVTTTQRMRDPGLTARESITKAGMRAASRIGDIAAVTGDKIRGVAGRAQGAMAYANSGRFDPTLQRFDDTGKLVGQGDFVDVKKMRQEAKAEMDNQRDKLNRGKFVTRLNYTRQMMRIARSETKFGSASKRFAQSGTGRMGTGMGLSLMSQYAPEEMRGAMALGGMVSTIDPRLGLAVAGVGGAMKAKSVGAGAMAGMAGGAAIGQMFGPYGALIGAGIGALGGAIMGAVNKNKALMDEARQAAQNSINSVFTGIAAAASRQFDRNREDQKAGIDISKRKRAFEGMSQKFSTKRQSAVLAAVESVFGADSPDFVQTYKDEVLKGANPNKGIRVPGGEGSAGFKDIVTQRGNKFGHSMEFGDGDFGNKKAREFIQYFYDNQKQFGMTITDAEFEKMTKSDSAARAGATRLSSLGGTQEKVLKNMEQVNDKRIAALSRATGKSGAELEVLAQELGVNLYDATVKYSDLVKQMGGAMIKTADQLNNALIDLFMNTGNKYQTNIKAREAQQTIDRASQGYRDKMLAKDATEEEKQIATDEYFADYASSVLALNKGDAFAAYTDTRDMFKRGDAFEEGNVFEGMKGTKAETEGLAMVSQMRKDMEVGIIGQMTGMAANAGQEFDAAALEKYISGLTDTEFETLAGATFSKNKATGKTRLENLYGDGGDTGMQNLMRVLKMDPTKLGYKTVEAGEAGERGALDEFTGDLKALADKQVLDYTIMSDAVNMYKTTTEKFFQGEAGGPDWWQTGLIWDSAKGQLRPPDTYSPRGGQIGDTTTSKLSQTMARHQAMDGQLTGKRTVTSSWRNFNLGSSNSDHVTGRAYDLVGQNLGKYATMIHANGGFAEFHGNMAERHLHVVPGPVPGVGDTPVPANNTAVVSAKNSSAGVMGNYTININGANASPEAIANMVVARLDDRERKYRER